MEYNWGDAEEPTKTDFVRSVKRTSIVNFNIRLCDLQPKCQEELRDFFKEFNDPRLDTLDDNYIVSRVFSIVDEDEQKSQ